VFIGLFQATSWVLKFCCLEIIVVILEIREYKWLPILMCYLGCGDNIKMDLQEVEWDMEWIERAQDRDRLRALVNVVMNLRVP
jgi:hypothetical protein